MRYTRILLCLDNVNKIFFSQKMPIENYLVISVTYDRLYRENCFTPDKGEGL